MNFRIKRPRKAEQSCEERIVEVQGVVRAEREEGLSYLFKVNIYSFKVTLLVLHFCYYNNYKMYRIMYRIFMYRVFLYRIFMYRVFENCTVF